MLQLTQYTVSGSARRGILCSAVRSYSASRPAVLRLPITAPLFLRDYSVTDVCFSREITLLKVVVWILLALVWGI
jgi:hypothetical protein